MDINPPVPAVLLVDDEESLLRSVRLVLRSAGINPVYTESNPRQVMERLASQAVALVLLDITMPHLSGETLLAQIHTAFPEISVIMLSASDDRETIERCLKLGARDYLIKPVERAELVAAIRQGLDASQVHETV